MFRAEHGIATLIADSDGPFDFSTGFADWTSIHDDGTVAFWAELDVGGHGVFTGDGTSIVEIAAVGNTYTTVGHAAAIHSSGDVFFGATLTSGDRGIFRGDGTTTTLAVEWDDPYTRVVYGTPSVNESGTVPFFVLHAFRRDIYVGPNPDTRRVVTSDDGFYGAQLNEFFDSLDLNDSGQVLLRLHFDSSAYRSTLYVATPITDPTQPIYVKADATGHNDGTSWGNAFTFLSDALEFAEPGDQVWIAAGTQGPGLVIHECAVLEERRIPIHMHAGSHATVGSVKGSVCGEKAIANGNVGSGRHSGAARVRLFRPTVSRAGRSTGNRDAIK